MCEIYLQLVEEEEEKIRCEERQEEMDSCTRPRTPTYEHLTCKRQRDEYASQMPIRTRDSRQLMYRYSDYEEAKAYHEGKKYCRKK